MGWGVFPAALLADVEESMVAAKAVCLLVERQN